MTVPLLIMVLIPAATLRRGWRISDNHAETHLVNARKYPARLKLSQFSTDTYIIQSKPEHPSVVESLGEFYPEASWHRFTYVLIPPQGRAISSTIEACLRHLHLSPKRSPHKQVVRVDGAALVCGISLARRRGRLPTG